MVLSSTILKMKMLSSLAHRSAVIKSILHWKMIDGTHNIQSSVSHFTSQTIAKLFSVVNTLPDSATFEQLNTLAVFGREQYFHLNYWLPI